jgi:SNF2 family DNA or RNA helicase
MKLTLHPYQQTMLAHVVEHDRGALFAGMGLGKTSTMLAAIDIFNITERGPVLVIAPKMVAKYTWPQEVAKWDQFSGYRVSPILGDVKARRAALKVQADIYTINYEGLPWLIEELNGAWPFGRVVADESVRLKGFRLNGQGGQRASAIGRVAHKHVHGWTNLTGTPMPNGLLDLWGQTWFIDAGQRLQRTYGAYKSRWFEHIPNGFGGDWRPRACAAEQIREALADVVLSVEAKDVFDLPELVVNKIFVELPSVARAQYRRMEKELYAEIKGNGIEAFNAAAKTSKCHQLSNGAVYIEPNKPGYVEVHDAKVEALERVISEACGAPVLVAYHFQHDLDRLRKAFPKARVLSDDTNEIADWNAGKIQLLLAHPESAGHGLNLQHGGNILVYFSLTPWKLEPFDQILERIGPTRQKQSGYDRPVFVHYLLARDTIDEDILERLQGKGDIQSILMNGLKRRAK